MAAASLGAHPVFGASGAPVIRLGVIGTGQRGSGLLQLLRERSDFSVVACCDILPGHLQEGLGLAAQGARGYQDYRALLDDPAVDAVVIATPLYLHRDMVVDALDAGKHVYCEKTLAYDIPQTLDIVRRVRAGDRVFYVGHQYRSYPLYHKIKEVIDNGYCGDIKHFICHYNRNNDWRRAVPDPSLERIINWRMYREYSGGLMAELSSHQIDVINFLLDGHPIRITGIGGINRWDDGRDIFDHASLVFEYENGVTGFVGSHLSNAHQGYLIKLIGTKGTIEIHRAHAVFHFEDPGALETGVVDGVSGATMMRKPGETMPIEADLEEGRDATDYAFADFAASIHTGRPTPSNEQTGADAAIAVHMANRAMEKRSVEEWKASYSYAGD